MPINPEKLRKAVAERIRQTLQRALTPEEYGQITVKADGSVEGPPEIVAKAIEILARK